MKFNKYKNYRVKFFFLHFFFVQDDEQKMNCNSRKMKKINNKQWNKIKDEQQKNTIKWKTIVVEHKIFNENGIENDKTSTNKQQKEVELSALCSYCCHFQHKYFITHFFL